MASLVGVGDYIRFCYPYISVSKSSNDVGSISILKVFDAVSKHLDDCNYTFYFMEKSLGYTSTNYGIFLDELYRGVRDIAEWADKSFFCAKIISSNPPVYVRNDDYSEPYAYIKLKDDEEPKMYSIRFVKVK